MSRPLRKFDIHQLDEVAWLHECPTRYALDTKFCHDIEAERVYVLYQAKRRMVFHGECRFVLFLGSPLALNHLVSSFLELLRRGHL